MTGYRIERCQGAGCSSFAQIAAPAGTGTSYSDTTAAASTSYSYRVRATDAATNLGPYTNTATATTPAPTDTQPPSAPGTLSASAISSGRIDLAWGAATDNVAVTGYRIERCQGAGCSSFAQIAAPAGTGTSYSDTTAAASTSYSYRVRATDAATNLGPYTNTATATTPAPNGPTPVAAYGFDEGSGTTVADASGSGNTGTAANTTWATGKYGQALSFNGSSSRVTVPDSASLRLTGAMTLEAWVNPTTISSAWRDVIEKGNDNYYLMATSDNAGRPAGGAINTTTYGTANLATSTWSHLAFSYDGSSLRLYLNGTLVSTTAKSGNIATSTNALTIGSDPFYGQYFNGLIDELRIYSLALTQAQIQTDMTTPLAGGPPTNPPTVAITAPANGSQVSGTVNVTANASDDVGVLGVQFFVDGVASGAEDLTAPYALSWDTSTVASGSHTLTAIARDTDGNVTASAPVAVSVVNTNYFQNEVLATGLSLPVGMTFLPDGRMLVAELQGTIRVFPPPYTQADPTPFLQMTNVHPVDSEEQGLHYIALDPNYATNHYYYLFYMLGSPNVDRLSRFTANAASTGTIAGSELVLYQDPQVVTGDHHGGAITFGNDGKLYFTTGDQVTTAADAQSLTKPRGKIHRINTDGTIPTDNPFYDGAGPNVDSIWARGLRNPFQASFDAPSGKLYIGDVGGNDYSTAKEEVDVGVRGANYAWPNCEGVCGSPYTDPVYSYPHNGRDACVVGGFVYRGSQFPSSYVGSYFFADYTQNWIRRLTFDANGNVNGVFNFEPLDGSVDGPYGDIVNLTEGPDGALYYVDIGFAEQSNTYHPASVRRIRYVQSNQAPVAISAADSTSGPTPLTVNFSSAGSQDPEGQPLTYSWTFGDGSTSTAANPSHTYVHAGQYTTRLTVSDGVNATLSAPIQISVGSAPSATILSPEDGGSFQGGDVISFSGDATDPDDGSLPASAYTWTIDFLHEGHVHPGIPVSGVKSGTFTIPITGHDFQGNTRFRISLTVIDSDGLMTSTSVLVFPKKVNLTFNTVPTGLTLYLDGIAKTTPFVYDTLIGFNHTIEARNQSSGSTNYTFGSWSDGGAQQHTIVVPTADNSYTATYTASTPPQGLVAAYGFEEGSGASVADASGSGNTGTAANTSWSNTGKYGNALSFNGTASRVTVPDSAALHLTGAMTLEAWVNPLTVTSAWRDVIEKGNDNYYLMATTTNASRPAGGAIVGGSYGEAFGTTTLPTNTWTHLALTYDGSALRLYVNGILVTTTAKSGSITTSTNALTIGSDPFYGQYFTGLIDEIRIYNLARTQVQIQSDMTTPVTGP